jgi:hypothetical protein
MFGRATSYAVRIAYRNIVKPGVQFRQETIIAMDPLKRRVTTNHGTYDANVLVVALAPTTISTPHPAWPKAATSSTPSPGLSACGRSFPISRKAAQLLVLLQRRSSVHRRQAKPHYCSTTISPTGVCATPATSASLFRSVSRFPRRPPAPKRCSPHSPNAASLLSPNGLCAPSTRDAM